MFYSVIILATLLVGHDAYALEKQGENQMNKNHIEQEVIYTNNTAQITLSGTLTLVEPTKKNPIVILIAGYGPNDRDYNFAGKQPFRVIADYFAQNGISVLRFDKRGVGKSTGDYTTATSRDFADDVIAGIEYLKTRSNINTKQIGLMGFSEGGLIASIVASESKDIAFVVLMAAAICTNPQDLITMSSLQLRADGASQDFIEHDTQLRTHIFEIITKEADNKIAQEKLHEIITHYFANLPESQKKESEKLFFALTQTNAGAMIKFFTSAWYRYYLNCKTHEILSHITVPVLALNGDLDWITFPEINFPIMEAAFKEAKNSDYSIITLSNLNHLFQTCKTGSMAEYGTIQETFSPLVLPMVSNWILKRIHLLD